MADDPLSLVEKRAQQLAQRYRDGDTLIYATPPVMPTTQVFITPLGALGIAIGDEIIINTIADWHALGRRT